MIFRSKFWVGAPLGLWLLGLVVALDGWLLQSVLVPDVRSQDLSALTFLAGLAALLSLPLAVVLAYETLSCATLRYALDRNGVTIRWLGNRLVIPIRHIQRIRLARLAGGAIVRRRGLRWPGHERGEGAVPGIGRTRFLATVPLRQQLLVITPGLAVAISPAEPAAFLEALKARQELGPNRLLEPESHRAGWLDWPLWADRTAGVLLGAALLINLGLFGFLCARYSALDAQLPLHFGSEGQVDRIAAKSELFNLPLIGLIVLLTDLLLGLLLYGRERAGSYLLWGAAAAAQALFWLATFSIVS